MCDFFLPQSHEHFQHKHKSGGYFARLGDLKAYIKKLNGAPRHKVIAMLEDNELHIVTIHNGPLTEKIYKLCLLHDKMVIKCSKDGCRFLMTFSFEIDSQTRE